MMFRRGTKHPVVTRCVSTPVPRHRNYRSSHGAFAVIGESAAAALINDLMVVTRNIDGFAGIGVRLFIPFD
ncbi:putative plasmid stability protein [Burkholderia latens]|uniref:Putative plasmid stability protein n=1 Tax=Burkholderia latens TaxID=488446 RepID=A0A6P2M175_9BURK|nr:putative plasmid stability protein [Burkholderia latens]